MTVASRYFRESSSLLLLLGELTRPHTQSNLCLPIFTSDEGWPKDEHRHRPWSSCILGKHLSWKPRPSLGKESQHFPLFTVGQNGNCKQTYERLSSGQRTQADKRHGDGKCTYLKQVCWTQLITLTKRQRGFVSRRLGKGWHSIAKSWSGERWRRNPDSVFVLILQ